MEDTEPDKYLSRPDGREANQIRCLATEQGLIRRADGSCRFTVGNTAVLAAVYGPTQPKYSRLEKPDRATIEVEFKSSDTQVASAADTEKQEFIAKTMESFVMLKLYPRTVILIVIQVLLDDGGLAAAAATAAGLALADAGVEMVGVPLGVAVCTPLPEGGTSGGSSKKPSLDPVRAEEETAGAIMTFVLSSAEEGVVSSNALGIFTSEDFFAGAEISTRASKALLSFIRASLEQKSLATASS